MSCPGGCAILASILYPDVSSPPDLCWLRPGFAVGSRPYEGQRAAIRDLGIDTVISLHEPNAGEAAAWRALGVRFLAFPTNDWIEIPGGRFTEVVDAVVRLRERGRTVLLHCLAGVNRAPTVAAAVLCRIEGLSPEEAVAAVRARRPGAAPTPRQMASLRHWAAARG